MTTTNDNAAVERWNDNDDRAFVSFSLGPVQSSIEAARSVRDLWTGSYLLSYLTFRAMRPILDRDEGQRDFVFPAVEELPLWKHEYRRDDAKGQPPRDSLLMPCIPNKFIAVVPREEARRLAEDCEKACRAAWSEIAGRVRVFVEERIGELPHSDSWDQGGWDSQVDSFFEIRTVVLPWRDAGPRGSQELGQ